MKSELIRIFGSIPSLAWTVLPDACADLARRRWGEYEELDTGAASGDEGWKAFIHGDDLPRVRADWLALRASGRAGSLEARMRHGNDGYRWFSVQMEPLSDDTHRVIKWHGVCTDIDDRKHPNDAFPSVERDFSSIMDAIPALAWSSRADGAAEFFNQHYLDFTGLSADCARGWGWTDAVHPDDILDLLESWRSITASRMPGEVEARMRRFDGEYRWVLFRLNPLRSECGHIIRWYGISIDIDDRKRAEARLRRSEAFLAEGQRTSMTGSFSLCTETGEVYCSEQLRRIFAFDAGHIRGVATLEDLFKQVHPDDAALLREKMETVQQAGANLDCEVRLLMPDGSVKFVHVVSHQAPGRYGYPEIVGVVQDVTQRRVTDEALGNLQAELARMAKINSLGVMTASIAHEVNQSLSGIITNASTCLRMLSAGPPNINGAIETARRTIRDGHRASEVITRVRALFSGKTSATERVNLNEAAGDVIALSRSMLKNTRVLLKTEFADDLPLAVGDRVQLQQVILNLLLNAAEAMGEVGSRERRILIRTERDADHHVRLIVKDSGMGFGMEEASKMFDTFYSTKEGGMGIGLAISKSIIERHHGRIGASPNDGPGASFWFSIPHDPDEIADDTYQDAAHVDDD